MNFVLDKLAAAGIEVVSSKAEFDRILENENIPNRKRIAPGQPFPTDESGEVRTTLI